MIQITFKEPKIRYGNKTYTKTELSSIARDRHKRYNKTKYNEDNIDYTTFYNSTTWKRTREQALIRDMYLCQQCLKDGMVNDKQLIVHHKVEIKEDWGKRMTIVTGKQSAPSATTKFTKVKKGRPSLS